MIVQNQSVKRCRCKTTEGDTTFYGELILDNRRVNQITEKINIDHGCVRPANFCLQNVNSVFMKESARKQNCLQSRTRLLERYDSDDFYKHIVTKRLKRAVLPLQVYKRKRQGTERAHATFLKKKQNNSKHEQNLCRHVLAEKDCFFGTLFRKRHIGVIRMFCMTA